MSRPPKVTPPLRGTGACQPVGAKRKSATAASGVRVGAEGLQLGYALSPRAFLCRSATTMVATVSNRARTTAAALGLDVDAILAQHDVEAFAERSLPQAAVRTQPAPPPTAITPKPAVTRRPASRPAASRDTPPESEDPLLLDGCRLEIMWPQSRVGKVRRRVGMVCYLPPPAQQSADQREHRAYLCLLERHRGGAPRERKLFGRTLLARRYEAR